MLTELSVEELRKKRIADLTVGELERAIYRLHKCTRITMTFKEFCETINRNEVTVRNLLKAKHYPERLIVGGYSDKSGSETRFLREEVEQWLKNIK